MSRQPEGARRTSSSRLRRFTRHQPIVSCSRASWMSRFWLPTSRHGRPRHRYSKGASHVGCICLILVLHYSCSRPGCTGLGQSVSRCKVDLLKRMTSRACSLSELMRNRGAADGRRRESRVESMSRTRRSKGTKGATQWSSRVIGRTRRLSGFNAANVTERKCDAPRAETRCRRQVSQELIVAACLCFTTSS